MSNELDAYLREPEPVRDGDYTSLQHRALDEVLRLSSAVADPLTSRIESEYREARRHAQDRYDGDKYRIEQDAQAQGEAVQQQYDARLKEIRADYEERLSVIKVDAQRRRKEAMQRAVELEAAAEKERQDQVMVAEFVAEGAVTRRKQKTIEARSTAEQTRQYLDHLNAQADKLLRLYRQKTPAQKQDPVVVPPDRDAAEVFRAQQVRAEEQLAALQKLYTAQLFAGARPVLLIGGLAGVALIVLAILHLLDIPDLPSVLLTGFIAAAIVTLVAGLGGRLLWRHASRRVRHVYGEFQAALTGARAALEQQIQLAVQSIEQAYQASLAQKEAELKKAQADCETAKTNAQKQRNMSLHEVEGQRREALDHLRQDRDRTTREAQQQYEQARATLDQQTRQSLAEVQRRYDEEIAACEGRYQAARRALEDRWDKGLACIASLLARTTQFDPKVLSDWDHLLGNSWTPAEKAPAVVRFGTMAMDLGQLADTVKARAKSMLDGTAPTTTPALLEFPQHGCMLIQYQRDGRPQAIDALRAIMTRLFTSFPPGQARFIILDPVGLGESFAGFMHAGDYQEALVGGRIWTEVVQIQQQLEDLTQHMENVIQKYLRNEFETIEQYNQQAGELAEPYRFLVVADFPANFNAEAARRLSSIIHSGPRCGVYTLIAHDMRGEVPDGVDIEDVSARSIHLVHQDGGFVRQDAVLSRFPLALDPPVEESRLTRLMHIVGKAGAESSRVEVPFTTIAPAEDRYWSLDSRDELCVPLGRTGATRLQYFRLGRGVAQHLLIAGKTGSGKSTLLHVMVTNLALWYAPDQVELYLIDFKQGVEFKTYATHHLPHARAIAIESDREFGLSILQRLDAEMARRGDLFRQAGVQDLAAYRKTTGKTMPRTVLMVDEFQVFFAEDDKLAQDASVLLEQLVRQGRAFGIHVVLGSQTLGGVFGLARSTIGQMAVRIALQCSEADSQLILDDDNTAARLLNRPGEAVYNDVGGRLAGNSPFQVAWLPDSVRDSYLSKIHAREDKAGAPREPAIVFEGSAAADITENRQLAACLGHPAEVASPRIWLGAPVTIKEPTAVILRRQSGANVLIAGQRDDVAINLMTAAMVSLAAQYPRSSAQFVILDGSSPDSPHAGIFEQIAGVIPHACRIVSWREVPDVIDELARAADKRMQADEHNEPAAILMVYGLQRYRMLRRSEDSFGLSLDEEAKPRPDVQFATVLREGPAVGIHVIAWADTLSTLERTLDRQTIREFDHRVLFQMSAADSSNLIDSPIANQLGFHRALLYSEEQGGLEKFRPYAAPDSAWLAEVGRQLAQRPAAST